MKANCPSANRPSANRPAALIVAAFVAVSAVLGLAVADENPTGGRDRLENLSVAEKEELRRKLAQFESLSEEEQQRLRQLHARLSASPQYHRLREVLLRYHEWLKTLDSAQRAELRKLSPPERISRIKELMRQQESQRFAELARNSFGKLQEPDLQAIRTWLDKYVQLHEEELLSLLPSPWRERTAGQPPSQRRRSIMFGVYMNRQQDNMPVPTDDEFRQLGEALSASVREVLDAAPTREKKMDVVQQWVRVSAASRFQPPVSRERMLHFYREARDKLPSGERERLESLPTDQFFAEIRKMHMKENMRRRMHNWRDHRPGGRGDRDRERGRGPGPDDGRDRPQQ